MLGNPNQKCKIIGPNAVHDRARETSNERGERDREIEKKTTKNSTSPRQKQHDQETRRRNSNKKSDKKNLIPKPPLSLVAQVFLPILVSSLIFPGRLFFVFWLSWPCLWKSLSRDFDSIAHGVTAHFQHGDSNEWLVDHRLVGLFFVSDVRFLIDDAIRWLSFFSFPPFNHQERDEYRWGTGTEGDWYRDQLLFGSVHISTRWTRPSLHSNSVRGSIFFSLSSSSSSLNRLLSWLHVGP